MFHIILQFSFLLVIIIRTIKQDILKISKNVVPESYKEVCKWKNRKRVRKTYRTRYECRDISDRLVSIKALEEGMFFFHEDLSYLRFL